MWWWTETDVKKTWQLAPVTCYRGHYSPAVMLLMTENHHAASFSSREWDGQRTVYLDDSKSQSRRNRRLFQLIDLLRDSHQIFRNRFLFKWWRLLLESNQVFILQISIPDETEDNFSPDRLYFATHIKSYGNSFIFKWLRLLLESNQVFIHNVFK